MRQREMYLPLNQGLVKRPRVHKLLQEATRAPLVLMDAGSGYGKTFAVADFVADLDCRLVWMPLSELHNLPGQFWKDLNQATRNEIPHLSPIIEGMGLPVSRGLFDAYLRQLVQDLYRDERAVMVLDNFHLITNRDILLFIKQLIDSRLENATMILCGISPAQLERLGLEDGSYVAIHGDDLRFSPEELSALFDLYNVSYTEESLHLALQKTGGWGLAVYLLANQLQFNPRALEDTHWMDFSLTDTLFEREYFSQYESGVGSLLIKLAHLPYFTDEIINQIGPASSVAKAKQLLDSHPFASLDLPSGIRMFQRMYKDYLQQKGFLLDGREKKRVYSIGARALNERGSTLEAIDLFRLADEYEEMLDTIAIFSCTGISSSLAQYLLDMISRLPESCAEARPLADYIKATIYLNNMEVDVAQQLLLRLAGELAEAGADAQASSTTHLLLGEVHLTLAAIGFVQNDLSLARHYRISAAFLPQGSRYKRKNQMIVGNNAVFFLPCGEIPREELSVKERFKVGISPKDSSQVQQISQLFHRVEEDIVHVFNGGGRGISFLFDAEAAYLQNNPMAAIHSAYLAIDEAGYTQQYDIQMNARFLLAKVALGQGNYSEFRTQLNEISQQAPAVEPVSLYELQDTILGWLYVKIGDYRRLPGWLIDEGYQAQEHPPIAIGRDRLIYAYNLFGKQQYAPLLECLEVLEALYRRRGHWPELLCVLILRAATWLNLGEEHTALQSLWQAYQMGYQDHILTPFLEGGKQMQALAEAAPRYQAEMPFDSAWLLEVHRLAGIYSHNLSACSQRYAKDSKIHRPKAPGFTKREKQILRELARGVPYSQITELFRLPPEVIQASIQAICVKLGAFNPYDAVKIAHQKGILHPSPFKKNIPDF